MVQRADKAGWVGIGALPLTAGQWYTLVLTANYTTNMYTSLQVTGPAGTTTFDLSAYAIAQESKWTQQAFWLTLEAENLWNNCGAAGAQQNRVYYDNVLLETSP
jgi:hypothetical protein